MHYHCIIIRKKEMFNLCDMLLHHMNYSIWGILSRTKLTNILVLLNSHDHSNLDTKSNCDHQIYSHIYAIMLSCPPWSIPYHPWPLSAHSYFIFQPSWPIVRLSYHPSSSNNKCKWSSGGACFLQMIIQRGQPLANDHLEGSSSKRRNWGFQNSWAFICFLREKYTLGEESIIFYVWSLEHITFDRIIAD